MEAKDITTILFILISVGLLLGVGMLALTHLGDNSRLKEQTVTHETITISSQLGQTNGDYLTSATFFGNGTHNTTEGNLVFGTSVNWTQAGVVKASVSDADYLISYVHDAKTAATTGTIKTTDTLLTIPTTWLPLIVVVAMLGIVLIIVLRSFGNFGRR